MNIVRIARVSLLHRKEAYTVVESPTEFSEGLKEARHECKYCGAKIHRRA